MRKKTKKTKKKARKSKSRRHAAHRSHLSHDHAPSGHHARLRKHHTGAGGHARKRSPLMERLHVAAAGARARLGSFGRRKQHHPEKLVTEQTLRDHLALKRIRRNGH